MHDTWEEGYEAYWDGKDLTDNPYNPFTPEAEYWDEGWEDAQEESYNEGV